MTARRFLGAASCGDKTEAQAADSIRSVLFPRVEQSLILAMEVIQTLREKLRLRPRATTIPLPYICPPTQQWDGNDGSWSTFVVSIGTPGQSFRVLPSTVGSETWVVGEQGCTSDDPNDCASLRGAEPFNGNASPGFESNQSSTWEQVGIYDLGLEADLGYTGNGEYGYDVVTLATPSSSSGLSVNHSIVAGTADKSYFLGLLGLNDRPTSFSSSANNSQSFLRLAKSANSIPSLSYGYTAGARYQGSGVLGSLTLGGYDSTRFIASNFSFPFGSEDAEPLQVGVQSIVADNTLLGTASLTGSNGFFASVDSTVPELWLPSDACELFANALGLSLDNNTGYYLVNDTVHSQLTDNNPLFTFKFGATDYYNGNSTNIKIPYAAFDLQLSWPIYDNQTRYFPLRQAANSSQVTIGRALLQEAYLIVDYERSTFSLNQVNFSSPLPNPQIVTIHAQSSSNDTSSSSGSSSSSSSSSLSGGAIAGIVIGAIAGLVLLGLLAFVIIRRRRRASRHHELGDTQVHHMDGAEKKVDGEGTLISEAEGRQLHEMASPTAPTKPPGTGPNTPIQEAPGDHALQRHEMETPPVRYEMSAGDEHIPKTPR